MVFTHDVIREKMPKKKGGVMGVTNTQIVLDIEISLPCGDISLLSPPSEAQE